MSAGAGTMRRYLVTRVALLVPNVLVLLTLVFVLMRVAPGDPIRAALGGQLSQAELDRRRAEAGYDRPLWEQYFEYLREVVRFDFGRTLTDNRPVTTVLAVNGAATLTLAVSAILFALVVGVPLGLIAARFRNSWGDTAIRVFGILTYATPVFFMGLVLIIVFSGRLDLLPPGQQASPIHMAMVDGPTHIFLLDTLLAGDTEAFLDGVRHLVLPMVTLGLLATGVLIRLTRVNVAQTLRDDYVEAARARGIAERNVVFHHAFRNAMVPFVTVLGLQFALLLGGAILTESTFSWPGLGSELVRYIGARDYLAVQGIMTVFALIVAAVSLLIDVVTALIDPRVRF